MVKIIHRLWATLLLCLLCDTIPPAGATATSRDDGDAAAASSEAPAGGGDTGRSGIIPLPMVAYTPETGVMGILSAMYIHDGDGGPDGTTAAFAMYTQKRQYNVGVFMSLPAAGNRLKLVGQAAFSRFPTRFYGIGPRSSWRDEEVYTPVSWNLRGGVLFAAVTHLYIGPAYHFAHHAVGHRRAGGMLMQERIPGSRGAMISGAGFMLEFDTRDTTLYPARGVWLQWRAMGYHRYLGSEFGYWTSEIDLRWFLCLAEGHVLAMQGYLGTGAGGIPFQEMMRIGGGMRLRGYDQTRYVDRTALFVQAEYRFPLFWRFGGVVFAGAGQVASSVARIDLGRPKAAAGIGLRFALVPARRINLRLDVGFTRFPPSTGRYAFYFLLREAF
ncbi:MAG: BamA/TamA family outer membrane protein [Spirochaetes bacterium]|nr:BamA/TamA family outer membrane protein [Spirochaetota bacterium]